MKVLDVFNPTRLLTITDDSHSRVAVGMRVCSTLGSVMLSTCKSSFFLSGESDCDLRNNRLILVDSDKMLLKKKHSKSVIQDLSAFTHIEGHNNCQTNNHIDPCKTEAKSGRCCNCKCEYKTLWNIHSDFRRWKV